jgi:hypothetical protein
MACAARLARDAALLAAPIALPFRQRSTQFRSFIPHETEQHGRPRFSLRHCLTKNSASHTQHSSHAPTGSARRHSWQVG